MVFSSLQSLQRLQDPLFSVTNLCQCAIADFYIFSSFLSCILFPSFKQQTMYEVPSTGLPVWRLTWIQHTPLSCWVFYQCASFTVLTQKQGKLQVTQSLGYNRFILFNEVWVILWQNWAAIPAEPFWACIFPSTAHLWGVQPKM